MYVQKPKVPWLKMAKSLPVWAVCIAHFTNNWGYYTLLTCLPMYLKNILHFDMKSVSTTALSRFFLAWFFLRKNRNCTTFLPFHSLFILPFFLPHPSLLSHSPFLSPKSSQEVCLGERC